MFVIIINRMKKYEESMIKLDLEQLGYLYKLHKSQWKKGWFVLRHGVLYKYHSHEVSV